MSSQIHDDVTRSSTDGVEILRKYRVVQARHTFGNRQVICGVNAANHPLSASDQGLDDRQSNNQIAEAERRGYHVVAHVSVYSIIRS